VYIPTHLTEGPWDPNAQFGGAPAALLATLVEQVPSLVPMQLARFVVDLMRPVPLDALVPQVRIVREGKRIQVVAASLFAGSVEVVRSSALRVRRLDLGDLALPDGTCSHPLPDSPCSLDEEPFAGRQAPGSRRAVEYLFEGKGGYYRDPAWIRLRVDVISGQPATPVARLAYTADLASGIGVEPDLPVRGINADLSINVIRYPEDEWIGLVGRGWINRTGVGQVQARLFDVHGLAASVSMARLVDPVE
jgi:Thioesterase-like superfamily